MALAHAQKTIGGVLYTFGKLPASKAMRVHVAMARVIAEALKGGDADALMSALKKGKPDDGRVLTPEEQKAQELTAAEQEAQLGALVAAVSSLAADDWVTPDGRRMMGLESLMGMLFEHVTTKEMNGAVDLDFFTGRGLDMYKVMAESLRFNFSDFLGASLSRSPRGEAPPA